MKLYRVRVDPTSPGLCDLEEGLVWAESPEHAEEQIRAEVRYQGERLAYELVDALGPNGLHQKRIQVGMEQYTEYYVKPAHVLIIEEAPTVGVVAIIEEKWCMC